MKNIEKSGEADADADADASSSSSRLPDEIILQILNKLIDLKALCFCYLVSRRFSSIVLQVYAISFAAPLLDPNIPDKNTVGDVAPLPPKFSWYYGESFGSASNFLRKFRGVKFLCIEPPSSRRIAIDNRYLVKWKEVSISDSGRRGRVSLSGEKLNEVKEWFHSASETELNCVQGPVRVSECYIPVLKLPVSGYVMKGVFVILSEMKDLQGGDNGLMNSEDGSFEDKEEAALYTEAVKEILEKHKAMMHTYHPEGALV